MAKLDFIERQKIDQLIMMTADKGAGYVLDFTSAKYQQFVIEKTGTNLYAKYRLSKGKNFSAIMTNESDAIAGKLLLETLKYMQSLNRINNENRSLFNHGLAVQAEYCTLKPMMPAILLPCAVRPSRLFGFCCTYTGVSLGRKSSRRYRSRCKPYAAYRPKCRPHERGARLVKCGNANSDYSYPYEWQCRRTYHAV